MSIETRRASPTGAMESLAILADIPTATIYEAAGKWGDVSPNIRPLVPGIRLAGFVFTVKAMPGDNLVIFRAIEEAPDHSVLVIDAGDTDRATIWGGTSTIACRAKNIVGCVTNGAARDIAEIRALQFPLYASGVNVRGTVKSHPGWTQLQISMGGVPVSPGDIVIGDDDGVIIVRAGEAEAVASRAVERRRLEQQRDERLKRGEPIRTVLGI